MEKTVLTYAKEEMVEITELGKHLENYLDKVNSNTFNKLAIIRRNKPEAVLISIHEYENLQRAYDILEQKDIEKILTNMTEENSEVSHTKTIKLT